MWRGDVDREIEHLRWLVGRMNSGMNSSELLHIVKDMERSLNRTQTAYWELQTQLERLVSEPGYGPGAMPKPKGTVVLYPLTTVNPE